MFASTTLTHEKVWLDKRVYDLAEKKYYENLAKVMFEINFFILYYIIKN